MIYFHIIYDLNELYNVNVSYSSGINYFIGKFSAILFMLLSGISSWFSKSNVKRGLKVAGIAIILTIITHLYDPAFGIKFGILHLLGTCMLLSSLLIKLNKNLLILLGSSVILLDRLISGINPSTNIFFPFRSLQQLLFILRLLSFDSLDGHLYLWPCPWQDALCQ